MYSHGLAFHGCAVADIAGRQSLITPCADEFAYGREGIVEPVSVNDKRVLVRWRCKKRKLETSELRLGDETRAFRPEIPERYEAETEPQAS